MITSLKQVHGATIEDILEATLGGVIRQKGFSYHPEDGCLYRTPAMDFRCAVGQIVADDEFLPACNAGYGIDRYNQALHEHGISVTLSKEEEELLAAAQEVHDTAATDLFTEDGQVSFSELQVAEHLLTAVTKLNSFYVEGSLPEARYPIAKYFGPISVWLADKIKTLE